MRGSRPQVTTSSTLGVDNHPSMSSQWGEGCGVEDTGGPTLTPPWFVCVRAAAHRSASCFRQPRAASCPLPAASSPVQPAPQPSLSSVAAPLLPRSVVLCCSVLEQPRAAIVADHHINARAVNRCDPLPVMRRPPWLGFKSDFCRGCSASRYVRARGQGLGHGGSTRQPYFAVAEGVRDQRGAYSRLRELSCNYISCNLTRRRT